MDVPEVVQHVVFRLADSLPVHVCTALATRPTAERAKAADAELDRGYGRRDLANGQIASLVENALLRFDGERYALLAWCVMPNHVHVLVEIFPGTRLDRVVHSWKSFTAHKANDLLGRHERFWAPEYFDRYMRDDRHLVGTVAYIEANPVKAGLCAEPGNWPFSSARRR